jgi:spermidine synthase
VDDDPSVIALAHAELADLSSLEIVQQDAFEYVATTTGAFDLACVDLYRGAQIQAGIIHRPFLRQLRSLLEPRGLAAFNLARDRQTDTRITRMGRVFRILRTEQVGKNLVVWCR